MATNVGEYRRRDGTRAFLSTSKIAPSHRLSANRLETGGARVQNIVASVTRAPREHDEQGRHQDCDEDRDARSASAPAQSDFIQRRLYAARFRGRGPQGGVSSQ